MLTEILLGKNIFRAVDRADSRRNILTMPIPKFGTLRDDIDDKLEAIIARCFQRDRDRRYQSAAELLSDMEHYLYSDGYGPTNEKLGVYLRDFMDYAPPGSRAPMSFATQPPNI